MITADEAKHLAQVLNGALGNALHSLVDPIPATKDTKKCDHKFLGSNRCAKCGVVAGSKELQMPAVPPPTAESGNSRGLNADQKEALYREFKARFIDEAKIDPTLLRLIMVQPELEVEVERQVVNVDGATLKGRCARLIAGGWFDAAKSTAATRKELARVGTDPSGNDNLRQALAGYRAQGFLTEEPDGWRKAPGIKITERSIER